VIHEIVTCDSAADTLVIDGCTHHLEDVEEIYVVGGNAAGAAKLYIYMDVIQAHEHSNYNHAYVIQ